MGASTAVIEPVPRAVCVSLHDVAASTWPACERLLTAVEAVAPVPITLLVVPRYHGRGAGDAAFRRALDRRLARGDELALHGYFHWDDGPPPRHWREHLQRKWYTAGEGEFSALGYNTACERLAAGQRWFARHGWPLAGFVAPAWLMNQATWKALRASGLLYTTTLRAFHWLRDGHCLNSQSLVYSTRDAWRRNASRLWNDHLSRRLRQAPLLRLSLHPADAGHPRVVAHWQRLLAGALADARKPMTKAEFRATRRAPDGGPHV